MQIVSLAHDLLAAKQRDPFSPVVRRSIMASWVKRLDTPLLKPRVEGLFLMDANNGDCWLALKDPANDLAFIEELRIRGCEKIRNGPDLFASNYELALVA